MAIDTKHAEYQETAWKKCRDVVKGQEQVHYRGELYLPKLSGQNDKDYKAYRDRATFYNATQRTVDAMSGLLFRKDPITEGLEPLKDITNDIDLKGTTLMDLAEFIGEEILEVGRIGILVDHPQKSTTEEITIAEAQANNLRPFIVTYKAEDIFDWSTSVVNNKKQLSRVILHEEVVTPLANNEFTKETNHYIRVLELKDKVYQVRIFKKINREYKLINTIIPLKNGAALDYIPFFFIGAKNTEPTVDKPPLLDLVNINLSHYKTTADLEHGAHYVGLPTAVVTGHAIGENEQLAIGSSTAWVFSEENAKASFLEFTGSGLDALEKRLEKKEQQMATLGARMLATEKADAETAETHNIKRQGENSALGSIAKAISSGVLKVLTALADWAGVEAPKRFEVNQDFIPASMNAQQLVALVSAWQAGGMDFEEFVHNLKKGEIIREDRDILEMGDKIAEEKSKLSTDPTNTGGF